MTMFPTREAKTRFLWSQKSIFASFQLFFLKTYKCLKLGQPFVIIGPPGSLRALRQRGYRVFDHAIDNSYDDILDNTLRWRAIKHTVKTVKQQDMHAWYLRCLPDVLHNQWLFATKSHAALDQLVETLTADSYSI